MKKLLITGFEPFGGENVNPSWEAVSMLPNEINGYSLTKLCLPVAFGRASEMLIEASRELSPDVVLSVGQAGGRAAVTPELVAINLRHASIPDNDGLKPIDEPVRVGGAAAYFSTLPVRKISKAISDCGIASTVSYSAGAYVCNDVFYTLLSHFDGGKARVGFIHVPYSDGQNKEPSMALESIVKALELAISSLE